MNMKQIILSALIGIAMEAAFAQQSTTQPPMPAMPPMQAQAPASPSGNTQNPNTMVIDQGGNLKIVPAAAPKQNPPAIPQNVQQPASPQFPATTSEVPQPTAPSAAPAKSN